MKKRKNDRKKSLQALTLVTQLGLVMILSIGLPCMVGIWLDRKLGTGYITIILFVMGVIAGFQSVYRMIEQIFKDDDEDDH